MNSKNLANKVLKDVDYEAVVKKVHKMMQHFTTYNFINLNKNSTSTFGFNTENLKHIIKNEWLLTNTVFCDQPSFQYNSLKNAEDLKIAFEEVKSVVNTVPFNLVEVDYSNPEICSASLEKPNDSLEFLKNLFKANTGIILKSQTFCAPSSAVEFFYKQQRDRKIWWRKFSSLPGRFHLTNISNEESNKSQFVEIQAEFPWGFETIELVQYQPDILPKDSFFEMKSQRKKFIPQVITCETALNKIALTYLCDSYEGLNEETDREMLRLSRKLAPYKVAFAASGTSAETIQNLKDLALLLAKKIRKCGIPVLLLPDMSVTSIERQVLRNDAIGVPYTILLNEKTLKDGLIAIRSRDTTLKEQSHVSLVVPYLEKLMKSF